MTMLQSIGAATVQPGFGSPGGAGILQTQLSRYETQLADWCNCPGGKTAEGKQKIADLQQKSDAVKLELRKIEDARTRQAVPPVQTAAARPSQNGGASTLGVRLDVYA